MNSTQSKRPITILLAALGGEGGSLLAEWIVEAAQAEGYPVQSTSIPGVAQRTGATTYYVEIWPEFEAQLGARQPILSLAPVPGSVDMNNKNRRGTQTPPARSSGQDQERLREITAWRAGSGPAVGWQRV